MSKELSARQRSAITWSKRIGTGLSFVVFVGLLVIAARLLSDDRFKFLNAELPLHWFLPLLTFATAVHAWAAWAFIAALVALHKDEGAHVYEEATIEGNWFVVNMVPRKRQDGHGLITFLTPRDALRMLIPMSLKDPSTYLALAAAMIVLVAGLPWRLDTDQGVVLRWMMEDLLWSVPWSAFVVALNWLIGSWWIKALSDKAQKDQRPDGGPRPAPGR